MLSGLIFFAGGGHGDGSINWLQIGALWINFFILLALLPKVLKSLTGRTPKEHLAASRDELQKQLEEAKAKQAQAESRLAEYAKKLENLEAEVDAIVKNYEAQGTSDKARIEEEADKAVERLKRESEFTIRQESLKAQRAIREAAVESTLRMAEELVKDRITDADRRRLADEYIGAVENGASL
jgi:F-type H+-transporting ATPase subunit b